MNTFFPSIPLIRGFRCFNTVLRLKRLKKFKLKTFHTLKQLCKNSNSLGKTDFRSVYCKVQREKNWSLLLMVLISIISVIFKHAINQTLKMTFCQLKKTDSKMTREKVLNKKYEKICTIFIKVKKYILDIFIVYKIVWNQKHINKIIVILLT